MIRIEVRKSNKFSSEQQSLFVTFPYDRAIVNIMRTFHNRYWHINEKEWELSINSLQKLESQLKESNYKYTIVGSVESKPKVIAKIPDKFKFKTEPFKHQREGLMYGLSNNKWLLADEQGLGKTKQIIDLAVAKKIERGYKHCLIICGVNGLKWNWLNEINTHSDEDAIILGQKNVKGKIVIGSSKDKLMSLSDLKHDSSYFIITNVETLRDEEIVSQIVKYCVTGDIGMIVLDEAHKCKNPSAHQTKGLLKLKADTMVAMTGTPLVNKPLDLYVILKWLGYENHSFYLFRNYYCIMGGFGDHEVLGYKNLEQLQNQLNNIMLRRLKKDVLDLPEKLYVDEYIDMSAKQSQVYKDIYNSVMSNIDKIKKSNNPLSELIRLRQATGYTGILSSTIKESAKLDRMEELIEEAIENGKQVVIFSNWTQMTDVVYARLRTKYATNCITGTTKDNERQTIVEDFQTGRCKVLVGTIGAMGTGLTLTSGTVEIFLDEPWNRANKEQAEDRCHRVGTKENVTIYTLICKDTIDEKIHELVYKKGKMADVIVDNAIDLNKEEIVDYLLS